MAGFFKPDDGWAADFIPFFWQGEYHLFYLKDYRDKAAHGEGTPWFHLTTRDFVSFIDHGEALPRGTETEQDLYVFTGCVIENKGLFHIYYTGHNPHLRAQGKPEQAIMHATSHDLRTWTKDPANPILLADPQQYEIHDWRDPFVFWNPEAHEYWMLLAARLPHGPGNRRGCTAVAASKDLTHWRICDPLWSPDLYFTHECPDLFRIGDWWYLVYSTFTERHLTHYRMSRSLAGPWLAPTNDSFDGRAFYAAKTASDGQRRIAFGWIPTRSDTRDTGTWNWGGSLVTHEIMQQEDGTLSVKPPREFVDQFRQNVFLDVRPQIGHWQHNDDSLTSRATSGFAWCRLADMPQASYLETVIAFTEGTRGCGVILRSDDTLDHYYEIRLEPGRNRVTFDRWPRPGDEPPIIERPVTLSPHQAIHLQVMVEGSIIVVYINGLVAMCTRGYEHTNGSWGFFVSEGEATFAGSCLKVATE